MDRLSEFVMMNWALFLALSVICVLLARSFIMPARIKSIRPQETVSLMNHDEVLVLDVRSNDEFQKGYILNSLHIPLAMLESRLTEIGVYKHNPVVICCRSGNRSYQAGLILNKQGFVDVYNLKGGILDWQHANLPLTTKGSKPLLPKPRAASIAGEQVGELLEKEGKKTRLAVTEAVEVDAETSVENRVIDDLPVESEELIQENKKLNTVS
jgi:rhodanese-related sulfurtransferase